MPIFAATIVPGTASDAAAIEPCQNRQAWIVFAALVACSVSCAAQDRLQLGGDAEGPPSLPGEARAEGTDPVSVDSGSIGLVDRSFDSVLGVRLDGYQEFTPAVVLEKGWLVSRRLGVGGSYSVRRGSTELVLNSVYAPRRDVRIQLSASQIRIGGLDPAYAGAGETLVQTGLQSGIKKQWGKSRVLPEAGFAVFTARAAGAGRQDAAIPGLEMGTLAGYMFRLAAVPMARTRVELGYQAQSTLYDSPLTPQWRERQASTSLQYSHGFDDCSLISGRFTSAPGLSETDLRYEKGAFSIGFLQTRSDDYADNMVQFSYSLALDSGRRPTARCDSSPAAPAPFRALVDAVTARPGYLPSEPLTRTVGPPDLPG